MATHDVMCQCPPCDVWFSGRHPNGRCGVCTQPLDIHPRDSDSKSNCPTWREWRRQAA